MPGLVRIGDKTTGHDDWPPTECIEGSSNVFANGKPACIQGSHFAEHCDDDDNCHTPVAVGGSSSIFINGKPAIRIGDKLSCGDTIAEGSPDINIGG